MTIYFSVFAFTHPACLRVATNLDTRVSGSYRDIIVVGRKASRIDQHHHVVRYPRAARLDPFGRVDPVRRSLVPGSRALPIDSDCSLRLIM